jgi:hypothetical protein
MACMLPQCVVAKGRHPGGKIGRCREPESLIRLGLQIACGRPVTCTAACIRAYEIRTCIPGGGGRVLRAAALCHWYLVNWYAACCFAAKAGCAKAEDRRDRRDRGDRVRACGQAQLFPIDVGCAGSSPPGASQCA